ncbi:MAG: hypothetical protein JO304_12840 [Solirubrobacterales bacterium]|nr:hypothetical protein [Solirubrobacterales bacterium]
MKRSVSVALACGLVLVLLGMTSANAAGGSQAPRLLINAGRSFQVRPAFVVLGMVLIGGRDINSAGYRAGRYGHIRWLRWSSEAVGRGRAWIPNGPGGAVRPYPAAIHAWRVQGGRFTRLWWAAGGGGHRYQEWDQLMRFGGSYGWRLTRSTGNP